MSAPPLGKLTSRPQFLAAAASGSRAHTRGLVLQARPHSDKDSATETAGPPTQRFGVTATKKIGNAVVRNRAKRRLRALAREMMPVQAKSGYDYVLIARLDTAAMPYAELRRDLATALRKLKLDIARHEPTP